MINGDEIGPGTYRMKYASMTIQCAEVINKGDQLRIEKTLPVDSILGLNIYEGTHKKSGHRVLVTISDITK